MMTVRADAPSSTVPDVQASSVSQLYQQGIVAGVLGAATIAIWFLILDVLNGRPLYTPTVLGTVVFRGGAGLDAPEQLAVDFDMVVAFTWLHLIAFVVIGGVASHLLALAEHQPNAGFGLVLLLVGFELGFIVLTMAFAEGVLHALTWPAILVGNTLAAATMALYLWRRHPRLRIEP